MILEVARELTDFYNDPDHGVAARLALIPRDDGDPLPDVGTIADQTRHNTVATMQFPSIPGIAVNVRQIPVLDGENNTVAGDGFADVLVRIARSNADAKDATRDSSYILRALLQSTRDFFSTTRTRNGVQINDCQKLAIAPDWTPIDDATVTGALKCHAYFRDTVAPA